MTNIDLDKADDETIERQLCANRGLAQAAEHEAMQLARAVIQIHPDPHRMRAETNDFARRMINLGMASRYRLARQMLAHFQCRDAEARALAEQDHQRNVERAFEAQRGQLQASYRAQWIERNGGGVCNLAQGLHEAANRIEAAVLQGIHTGCDYAGLLGILDDAERAIVALKGQVPDVRKALKADAAALEGQKSAA